MYNEISRPKRENPSCSAAQGADRRRKVSSTDPRKGESLAEMNLKEKIAARREAGVSLTLLNYIMIVLGVIIAVLLVITTYQTGNSITGLSSTTASFLTTQQTCGMLSSISASRREDCRAFLETGEISRAFSWAGQTESAKVQVDSDAKISELLAAGTDTASLSTASRLTLTAVHSYRQITEMELHALRLMAATMPMPLSAFPALVQEASLTEEEEALSKEEKQQAAFRIIEAEEYTSLFPQLTAAVDESHREGTQEAKVIAYETTASISAITNRQKILVFLFILIAVLALILNRIMIIRPIEKSVANLDHREKIPVQGSYEMRHLARVYNDVLQDNERKSAELSFTATHDPLTGVYNRAAFDRAYKLYGSGNVGVMIVDVDEFKHYNDQYGHDVGDLVLKEVAGALKQHFRTEDHISRIGGDEFCVIILNTGQDQASQIQEKVSLINSQLAHPKDGCPAVAISAGIAFWDRPNPEHDLFKDADMALLKVKQSGRGTCGVHM